MFDWIENLNDAGNVAKIIIWIDEILTNFTTNLADKYGGIVAFIVLISIVPICKLIYRYIKH